MPGAVNRPISALSAEQARDLVRQGYDAISLAYRSDDPADPGVHEQHPYEQWVDELAAVTPAGGRVVDLGCGNGLPASRLLVERGFDVLGVDFSAVQIGRARSLVPRARFEQADLVAWDAPPAGVDAVVSFYALIHVPQADQRALLPRLATWLRPGGHLLATVGAEQWTGVEDYLGAPMFWDHADAATTLEWLGEAGLEPQWYRFVPEGDSGHTLVLARRP